MALKFANSTISVGNPNTEHGIIRLTKGEAWDADDPFVKARQDLFDDEPPVVRGTRGAVETATAVPGGTRKTKRTARKS